MINLYKAGIWTIAVLLLAMVWLVAWGSLWTIVGGCIITITVFGIAHLGNRLLDND